MARSDLGGVQELFQGVQRGRIGQLIGVDGLFHDRADPFVQRLALRRAKHGVHDGLGPVPQHLARSHTRLQQHLEVIPGQRHDGPDDLGDHAGELVVFLVVVRCPLFGDDLILSGPGINRAEQ
ncbi:hypothetical protein D3C78_1155550 [compost metagenome]